MPVKKLEAVELSAQVPMGLLESIDIDVLEMGETPMRMGGIKVLLTAPPAASADRHVTCHHAPSSVCLGKPPALLRTAHSAREPCRCMSPARTT